MPTNTSGQGSQSQDDEATRKAAVEAAIGSGDLDLTKIEPSLTDQAPPPFTVGEPFDPAAKREGTRGDLARGLLWLLALCIGGVLTFIPLGLLEGSVLTQSVFPSLIALAGTALGFYFGSVSQSSDRGTNPPKP